MIPPVELLRSSGGRYATSLGISLDSVDSNERFRWLIASLLFGARISASLASRAWHELDTHRVLTPQCMLDTGRDGLVALLDAGGYARYDFKTADKLLAVCNSLVRDYAGDLDALHAAASGPRELEDRIKALAKGIGDTTTGIFLRELRGIWDKSAPQLSPLAITSAQALGYIRRGRLTASGALERLQRLWAQEGKKADSFPDFEAALVREGLQLRREASRRSHWERHA